MARLFEDLSILEFGVSSSWARGDFDKTIVLCPRLLKLSPGSHYAYWKLAQQLLKKGQHQKAKQKWKRAIELYPALISRYDDWVYALYFEREYEEAILFAERYPDKFYVPCDIQNALGMCYLHLGDYESAVECFEKTTLMKAGYSVPYFNWALALHLQGKEEEALEVYRKACQISDLCIPAYEREVSDLKEDLKREENKIFEDLIKKKIEGFEYFIEIERKKGEKK